MDLRKTIVQRAKSIIIKIGSGVLTEKEGLNTRIINQLANEIAYILKKRYEIVMVSSGAIAAGVGKMKTTKPKTISEQQAAASVGQCSLILAYEKAFARHSYKVAQVLLTRDDLSHRRRYLNARNTIFTLLNWGIIPIINENDTVVVEEIMFGDNDNLSAMIANLIEADLLVMLTDIDGLYDKDPRRNKKAKLIPLVEKIDHGVEKCANAIASTFGRGGMLSKVQAAKKVSMAGIPTIVANGTKRHVLRQIFDGKEVGTLFLPQKQKISSRKHWIAFTIPSKGEITIDDGAKTVIIHNGKSLLPSGILKVKGKFGIGSAVQCLDRNGFKIGTGLVNYSSSDIEKIRGHKTSEIEGILGYKYHDEVIHRDNLMVFETEENLV